MNGEVLWDKTTGLECEYDVRGEIIILVQKLQEDHIKAKLAGHLFEEISLVMTKVEDESYGLYIVKRDGIHLPLVRHAMTLEDAFNKLKCVTYKKAKAGGEGYEGDNTMKLRLGTSTPFLMLIISNLTPMLSLLCLTTFCSKTTTVQAYLLLLRSDQLRLHDVSMYKATASTRVGVPSVELHRVPSVPGFKNHRHQRFQDPVEISAHRPLLWILAQAFPYPGIRSFQETQ
ncbi:hypothetical protein V6N11_032921 [Hibiscus sabdariffa]|uniref:Uncharacterized protein n=1 Tax=Hibiscus sabdariffa TaxID=183260 RepID=A0ABR2NCA7_9ROSI